MTTFPDRMGSDGISGGAGDASGPGSSQVEPQEGLDASHSIPIAVQAVIDAARKAVAHHSRGYSSDLPWDANVQIILLDQLEDALAAMDYPAPEGNAP